MNKKVLIAGIIFSCMIMIFFVYKARNQDDQSWSFTKKHRREPVSTANLLRIAPWMTFEYLNEVFNLPPSYLQEVLKIQDTKYPRITINQYSKKIHSDVGAVIKNIQQLVNVKINTSDIQY